MAITPKQLFKGAVTSTAGGGTAQKLYTNPLGVKTIITSILNTNTDSVIRGITLSNVSNSSGSVGTEAQADRFLNNHKVPINGETSLEGQMVLESQNDTIQAFQEVASAVNVQIMGVQIT